MIESIETDNRRELFVDRFLVNSLTNTRREFQHPQPAEPDVCEKLSINMSASAAGIIAVEIQDNAGKPIPGIALSDFDQIIGDQIIGDQLARMVVWSGKTDVSQLPARRFDCGFELKIPIFFRFNCNES